MTSESTGLRLPDQTIPVPTSISPQGQAYLAAAGQRIAVAATVGAGETPAVQDMAAAALGFLRPMAETFKGLAETIDLPSGAKLYRMTPEGRSGRMAKVAYFDVHGGGFSAGGGEMCELLAKIRAAEYGAEVYAVDYRLLPDHPFPAGLDDCLAAYREILARCNFSDLVVAGASAGGNLAAAMLLRARDQGLPLPAALLMMTPAVDMTRAGDSYQTNRLLDVNLPGGEDAVARYGEGTDPKLAYISPLFGDFTKGWPPTLLTTGTRDLLLSDTVRMHRALRRAGVVAELHVSEASPHGGFMGTNAPEEREIRDECRAFVRSAWKV